MDSDYKNEVFTIGHSNHSFEKFMMLITKYGINAIVDVRSYPYSKYNDIFNRERIANLLNSEGIKYFYLGNELGGRPKNKNYYDDNNKFSFDKIKNSVPYKEGIKRLIYLINIYKVAVVCSEKNPCDCHRFILIGRTLKEMRIRVMHILYDGNVITQESIENDMINNLGTQLNLFRKNDGNSILEDLYSKKGFEISHKLDKK